MRVAHPVVALVEDDSATITVITDLLITGGFLTFHWRQGNGAHELIKERQPQAVILDIRLEYQRAGSDVLDRLRDDPATRAIPIIVCTGDEDFLQENKTRLREQRCAVVQKPFTLDHLLTEIKTMLDRTPGRARWNAAPRNGSAWHVALPPVGGALPAPPVIALVDRNPQGITCLTERLMNHGYDASPWRWGNGIYEMVSRERPAMVVIEIEQADRRAAWITLNRLQRDPETRAVPVMICSSDAPFLATQAGRHLVMQKPVEPRALLSLIATVVGPPPPKPTSKRRERDQSA